METDQDIVSRIFGENGESEDIESDPESNESEVIPQVTSRDALLSVEKLKHWLFCQVNRNNHPF